MHIIHLAMNLILLVGAINTGVLVSGDRALLFDCCDTVTSERLKDIGVKKVDMILCTQHRRVNVAGAYEFVNNGAELVVPEKERDLFDKTEEYWSEWKNRWHLYYAQPGPDVLAYPLPVNRSVKEGDTIQWEGYNIRVLDTPGATMGAVSYLVDVGGKTFCFSGDALYGPGQIWDIYSLQKGYDYGVGDYHGFLGNRRLLIPSLKKLGSCGASALIPSHGSVINNPLEATELTIERISKVWLNFSSITSLRHFFPEMVAEGGAVNAEIFPAALWKDKVDFCIRIPETTWVIISETGAAFVMDCGDDHIVSELQRMIEAGKIKSVEGAWITHNHDDHIDGIGRLYYTFGCPIITNEHVADILRYPRRYFVPCVSNTITPITRVTHEGESWKWQEFTFTSYHLPGQTLYHGALLVEGRGKRILFTGDSFSPYGIDDYFPPNRNFLGKGRGYDYCLDLVRKLNPDFIINAHISGAMKLSDDKIDYIKKTLVEREKIFSELLPWENPNFGTDVWWVRTYPYEQDTFRGNTCSVDVQFTNHGNTKAEASVEPVLPKGWKWDKNHSTVKTEIGSLKDGSTRTAISIPANAKPGQYIIPFRVTWDNTYLGQFRHAVIYVME